MIGNVSRKFSVHRGVFFSYVVPLRVVTRHVFESIDVLKNLHASLLGSNSTVVRAADSLNEVITQTPVVENALVLLFNIVRALRVDLVFLLDVTAATVSFFPSYLH